jgi:hypothetical protein
MPRVELSEKDLRLLLQSLEHCLATCQQKAAGGGPCEDCEAAAALRDRIQAALKTSEATR